MKTKVVLGIGLAICVTALLLLIPFSMNSHRVSSARRGLLEEWAQSRPSVESVLVQPNLTGSDLRPVVATLNKIDGLWSAYVKVNPVEAWTLTKFEAEVLPVLTKLQDIDQPLTLDQRRQVEDALRTLATLGERWQ